MLPHIKNIFLTHLYENPIRKELISLLPLKSIPIEKNDYKCLPLSLEIEEDNKSSNTKQRYNKHVVSISS